MIALVTHDLIAGYESRYDVAAGENQFACLALLEQQFRFQLLDRVAAVRQFRGQFGTQFFRQFDPVPQQLL